MADIDNDQVHDIEVGIIGSGSMGSGMTLLFSEHHGHVGCYDYEKEAVQKVMEQAKKDDTVDASLVHGFTSLEKLVGAFPQKEGKAKILVLSLPHGKPVDDVQKELLPLLGKGDIVIDAGNEWWQSTERRQKIAKEKGVEWVGMGVSGGYQAARHGPSMSPGCSEEVWKVIKPSLEKWAAKTPSGEHCVMRMGPGGAGHYVKMIHNGIEHGHLSIIAEMRALLHYQLGFSNDDIAATFEQWHKDGPLRGNFLIGIGYKGLRFKDGDGIHDKRGIVEGIEDKVTQDVDLSEGTGTWSAAEIATRHVAAPSIAASHQLRIISSDKLQRLKVADNIQIPQPSEAKSKPGKEIMKVFEKAMYGAILSAFVSGLEIIAKASKDQNWDVSLHSCLLIWRAGCIIQSGKSEYAIRAAENMLIAPTDAIAEFLLPLLEKFSPSAPLSILKDIPEVAKELSSTYQAIKEVYKIVIDTDAVAPAMGATLEWLKSVGGRNLPTDFEELELDYFGHHNYDLKADPQPGHEKGTHHTEFAPA